MTPEQIIQKLNWRYATKKFARDRQISPEDWHALEQSLILSPSSFGQQPWKFVVIRNPDLRQQLQQYAWNQSQVVDASHLVVLASKKDVNNDDVDRYIKRVMDVRQMPIEKLAGMKKAIKGFLQDPPFPLDPEAWSTRQVYLALGFFVYSAALLGIDACPIEGFKPDKFDEVLGLADKGYATKVLCAVGYRSSEDKLAQMAKVRYQTEEIVEYID